LSALTAFVSVAFIVLGREPHIAPTFLLAAGWLIGTLMQIIPAPSRAFAGEAVRRAKIQNGRPELC
jgi:hypothetical protein